MATLFTQLTMLNMIIAIMGDSFDYATENRVLFDTEPRLQLLSSLVSILPHMDKDDQDKVYMIIVRPIHNEEEEETW